MSTSTAVLALAPLPDPKLLYRLGVQGKSHLNDQQCRDALRSHGLLAQGDNAFPEDFPPPALQLGIEGRECGVARYCGGSGWVDGPHSGDCWLIRDVEAYIKPRYAVVLAERARAKAAKQAKKER